MFCMNCGKALPDGAKFCMYCGTPLGAAAGARTERLLSARQKIPVLRHALSGRRVY